jgi:hypothetical protein
MVAQRKPIRFRSVDIWHVADRAGRDQRADHGGAQRAGSAGDDHVAVTIVHRPLPLFCKRDCIIGHASTDARWIVSPIS